ncbi:MAG: nucleotidyl transferase AbiEii/AbiGii toxin family protein [Bacteroidota bacterium]
MIRALSLLESLVAAGLKFMFKGGTSLILLLPEPRRFSVDVDIVTEHSREDLEISFDEIIKAKAFKRWELDERRSYKGGIPKAHYKFYFDSAFDPNGYVLLDVVFDKHRYPTTQITSVQSSWVKIDGKPTLVETPNIDSILGDKLTAFAPNTTGVLFGKEKSLEIVKQLHDVGQLFDHIDDISIVAKSFENSVDQGIAYRKLHISREHVLDDIIATSAMIAKLAKHHGEDEKSKFEEIVYGLKQFRGYTITGNFTLDNAIESAAKSAYLAAKIKAWDNTPIEKPIKTDSPFQFTEMPYSALNRLRKFNNGSMFYWTKTAGLLGLK